MSRYKSYKITTFATYHFQHIAYTGNYFVLDLEWFRHNFQTQCDGKSLACEVCHWGRLPSKLFIATLSSVVLLFVNTHRLTSDVKDLLRSGKPCFTSRREDNALRRLVRRNPFANSTVLKRQWLPHRLLSARTVRNRLTSVSYLSRRPVKRYLLTQTHKDFRLQWCQTRR